MRSGGVIFYMENLLKDKKKYNQSLAFCTQDPKIEFGNAMRSLTTKLASSSPVMASSSVGGDVTTWNGVIEKCRASGLQYCF
jgi:hypothetical protein